MWVKKVRIAFKYISTATKAKRLWEIQNVVVKNTEAVVVTTNYGDGTEASPYTLQVVFTIRYLPNG